MAVARLRCVTVDLAALDNFLASDRAPSECMQLSELDGFLASIVAGPEPIPRVYGCRSSGGWTRDQFLPTCLRRK